MRVRPEFETPALQPPGEDRQSLTKIRCTSQGDHGIRAFEVPPTPCLLQSGEQKNRVSELLSILSGIKGLFSPTQAIYDSCLDTPIWLAGGAQI